MNFYLSRKGEQVGPWVAAEILHKLESSELNWTDYLFDEVASEWVLLMDHPEFANSFKSWIQPGPPRQYTPPALETQATSDKTSLQESPPLPKVSKDVSSDDSRAWFILRDSNKHGPFDYLELVRMLQEKKLFEYDFVWSSNLSRWKAVAEVEDFKPDSIKMLSQSADVKIQEVFFRRRHERVSYGASLLVHDSKSVWKGLGLELSPGGAGIVVDQADFTPGQTLFLHFKAGDGVPPFNAICTVVSKQHVKDAKSSDKALRYGVEFTSISQSIKKAIRTYTEKVA